MLQPVAFTSQLKVPEWKVEVTVSAEPIPEMFRVLSFIEKVKVFPDEADKVMGSLKYVQPAAVRLQVMLTEDEVVKTNDCVAES